jgi:hypothetical protein
MCHSVLNPTSSLLVYIFAVTEDFWFTTKPMMVLSFLWITKNSCFKSLPACNKTNDGIVLPVDGQKNCFKSVPIRHKTNDGIVFPVDHKKMFESTSGSKQN